jgi:glycosyltransferase involved in cell wall biosynthesis
MSAKQNLSILYLGKRGGGAKFALMLSKQLSSSTIFRLQKVAIRKDNELYSNFDNQKTVALFNSGISLDAVIKVCKFLLSPQKLLNSLGIKRGEVCLIPMISPIGLVIEAILNRQGVYVLRFLHDAQRHPGDLWPTRRTINKIITNSSFLVALSNNVAKQILVLNPKIIVEVYEHPIFDFSEEVDKLDLPKRYFLFLGRIRKYKGVATLIAAFRMLRNSDISLVVAGEGRVNEKLPNNSILINRWLLEGEISELVRHATIICFPYIESSQSGLIPFCISKNKTLVITPNNGLVEQVGNYRNVVISKDYSVHEFKNAMEAAIKLSDMKISETHLKETSLEKCILKSPYFVE